MIVLPMAVVRRLLENARLVLAAEARGHSLDPAPVLKLFNPAGPQTWLATELSEDGDTLFGLADLGIGCPEMGYFSLREIAGLRLPFGLSIERDRAFSTPDPLSAWAGWATRSGSIRDAEYLLQRVPFGGADRLPSGTPKPSNDNGGDRSDG